MANDAIAAKKCVTPEFRVSFPSLLKPKAFEGQEPKYSVTMLFPKKTDLSKLKACAKAAIVEKWGDKKEKWPKGLRMPFRDGDEKETDGYEGHIFVSASSKTPPGVVNQSLDKVMSEQEVYAGCYARAEIIAFAYDTKGNKGVSFSLQNVQKLREGEPFSGRSKPEDVFDAVETTEDDEDGLDAEDDGLGF